MLIDANRFDDCSTNKIYGYILEAGKEGISRSKLYIRIHLPNSWLNERLDHLLNKKIIEVKKVYNTETRREHSRYYILNKTK